MQGNTHKTSGQKGVAKYIQRAGRKTPGTKNTLLARLSLRNEVERKIFRANKS